ncbi:MAG TPA: DedA family protein, partial [Chromatiaceae bacterium]|nr:DedA family protein [Chromatiaceae bacterium]
MKLFSGLYRRVMRWSRHPRAPWYLGVLSFAESSFFPIPPDVMLAPMSLGQPKRAWKFALLTTLTSVVGGVFGYLIGWLAFDLVSGWLQQTAHYEKYLLARE